MKFINKFKSQNFDNRKLSGIKIIIIHYTSIESCNGAIEHMCDVKNKVSSHYLISQSGEVYNIVDEKKRAWHAGISYWKGESDINSISLGIELDYSFKKNNNIFSKKMINSLINLLNHLKKKYKINNENIIGHSDIAPLRKIDPGNKFPWNKLANKKLTFIPEKRYIKYIPKLKLWFKNKQINSKKRIVIYILNYIGYETKLTTKNYYSFKKLIKAYQTHYLQKNITSKLDSKTYNFLLLHFLNLVLTKNKKIIRGY